MSFVSELKDRPLTDKQKNLYQGNQLPNMTRLKPRPKRQTAMKEIEIKKSLAAYFLRKSSTEAIFFEYPFHFGRRRADLIRAENGMIEGYEIKSAYDRTDRLEEQLTSYARLFDFVYVVCDKSNLSTIRKLTPERIGIYLCTPEGIKRIRCARQIKDIDPIVSLDALPIAQLRREFGLTGRSKLEICKKIASTNKKENIRGVFRKHVIQKYGAQTTYAQSETSNTITLDDILSLSLAPNKLGA